MFFILYRAIPTWDTSFLLESLLRSLWSSTDPSWWTHKRRLTRHSVITEMVFWRKRTKICRLCEFSLLFLQRPFAYAISDGQWSIKFISLSGFTYSVSMNFEWVGGAEDRSGQVLNMMENTEFPQFLYGIIATQKSRKSSGETLHLSGQRATGLDWIWYMVFSVKS